MQRRFISANITESMWSGVNKERFRLEWEESTVRDLIGLNFLSSLTNRGLVGSLQKRGVNVETGNTYINLEEGDELYVINVLLKSSKPRDYKEEDELPEEATLKVTKYFLKEK